MAIVSKDKEIFILDENYDVIQTLTPASGPYNFICFSPDETMLLTCSRDNKVTLWDLNTYSVLFGKQYDKRVFSMCFNPNGEEIIVAFRYLSLKFLTIDGHDIDKFSHIKVKLLIFNPVENQFLTCGSDDDSIILWNSITGEEILKIGHQSNCVLEIKFSPDGSKFFISLADLDLKIFDTRTGEIIFEFNHISAASFSADSSLLVTASLSFGFSSPQQIDLFNLITGEVVYTFTELTRDIRFVELSSNGNEILYVAENSLRENMYKMSFIVHDINDGTSTDKHFGDEEGKGITCMAISRPQLGSYI